MLEWLKAILGEGYNDEIDKQSSGAQYTKTRDL